MKEFNTEYSGVVKYDYYSRYGDYKDGMQPRELASVTARKMIGYVDSSLPTTN